MNVLTDELAGFSILARGHTGQEINHSLGIVSCGEVKVEAMLCLLNVDRILMGAILQDQLLEVEERPLVWHLLPNLNDGSEGMVGETLHTVRALLCGNDVFDLECLLDDGALEGLLLDGDLDFNAARVGFGPDETGIDDSDLG